MPDLDNHLGAWRGTWRTYLEPDEPFDDSAITATVQREGGGYSIEYAGLIGGDEVTGSMRWQESGGTTTVEWLDTWHTGGETQSLVGVAGAPPSYQYGEKEPWTWDITIETWPAAFAISHHNAGPGVPRYLGVIMQLDERISD